VVIACGIELQAAEDELAVLHLNTLRSFYANIEEVEGLGWVYSRFDNLNFSLFLVIPSFT
jgi:hypothetical protein